MDEQASFEPQAVLTPRRAGRNRLLILVPALAFAAAAWAGVNGARPDANQAAKAIATPAPTAPIGAVATPRMRGVSIAPGYPRQVLGIDVQSLDDIRTAELGRDEISAVAGWYVATAISDCPRLAAIYRQASLPEVRHDADPWAYCARSGVLYASRPDLEQRLPTNNLEDNRSKSAGLPAVPVALSIGVLVPPALEMIGTTATPVVVLGQFARSGTPCAPTTACRGELIVAHVAWVEGIEVEGIDDAGTQPGPRLPADGTNVVNGG